MDTSVVVALINKNDIFHVRAKSLVAAAADISAELVYFDCVMTETISVLARRAEEKRRSHEFGHILDVFLESFPIADWFGVSELARDRTLSVLAIMRETWGALNFNDALIAVACKELGDAALLSFDSDFDRLAGFRRISTPEQFAGST